MLVAGKTVPASYKPSDLKMKRLNRDVPFFTYLFFFPGAVFFTSSLNLNTAHPYGASG